MNPRHSSCPAGAPRRSRRGSILIVVMVTLLFATFALLAFMERATNDLLVDQREVLNVRLRKEAYSALEVTLAVLERFREVNGGLRSPSEGWQSPLEFAEYTPFEGRKVTIAFEDESGKISLPRANAQVLLGLFKNWGMPENDAESLADAMMGWMDKSHIYSTSVLPDYETNEIPYEEPGRPIRSYSELLAIAKVREMFYDKAGRPNEYWRRFVDSVSLFSFQRPNINGAKPDTLAAVGLFDPSQQGGIRDYLAGTGGFQSQGPNFFRNPAEAQQAITGVGGNLNGFSATISALRIVVTVTEGRSEYRLATVISPPNGATSVQTNATEQKLKASDNASKAGQPNQPNQPQLTSPNAARSSTGGQNAATRNLRYPFTLLEMRENDEIPPPPPPPAPTL